MSAKLLFSCSPYSSVSASAGAVVDDRAAVDEVARQRIVFENAGVVRPERDDNGAVSVARSMTTSGLKRRA